MRDASAEFELHLYAKHTSAALIQSEIGYMDQYGSTLLTGFNLSLAYTILTS